MPHRPPWRPVPALVLCALALVLAPSGRAAAQASFTAPHVTVRLVVPPAQIYPGQRFTAGLDFKMEKGWHVYWQNAGDSGEPPAADWELPPGVAAAGFEYPVPARLPLGPLMDFGYENEVVFPVPMQAAPNFRPSGTNATIAAHLTWLVCRAVCIPGKGDVAVTRTALAAPPASPQIDATAQAVIASFEKKLPQPLPGGDAARFQTTPTGFVLDVATGSSPSAAQFFPLDPAVVANAAPQTVRSRPNGVQLALVKDETLQGKPATLNGVLELADGTVYQIHASPGTIAATTPAAASTSAGGLLEIAGLAFLGGLILNLMPCVFPVLFIKVLALVQSGQQERHRLRAHGWIYTLGILVSFWTVVAVLLVLRAAGRQLGWGFQFQSPVFLALMAMLLFFLGLALAGQFEIGLSLTSAGGGLAQKHGYAGSFFTGILAMVVATPCTAPFMGAAVGYALAHSVWISFAVFTALAFGLAAPYIVLSYFPAWARLLPKPGRWMEILKQAVAIPVFGTVIWLVWVFTQLAGSAPLAGLLAAFLLVAIAGWFLGRWPGRMPAAFIATIVIAVAVAGSVWTIGQFGEQATRTVTRRGNANAAGNWQPFSPAALAQARAQGHPVFVDFTASWCLSCQVNERLILDRADVEERLRDSGAAMLRADWTNQDPVITKALAALGRSGVPTYAIYPADPSAPAHVLPEVLTPGIVIDALQALPKSRGQAAAVAQPGAANGVAASAADRASD